MNSLINQLQHFCQEELDRRRAGLVSPTSLQCYFRNESAFQGTFWDSVLIRQATERVWSIWPEKGVYTIVRTTGRKKYPGLNFRMAGWGVLSIGPKGFCKIGAYISWFEDRS